MLYKFSKFWHLLLFSFFVGTRIIVKYQNSKNGKGPTIIVQLFHQKSKQKLSNYYYYEENEQESINT